MKRIIIVFTTLVFVVSGCQQESNILSGTTGYIQFKIDGREVRIEECQGIPHAYLTVDLNNGTPLYTFQGYANQCNQDNPYAELFQYSGTSPISIQNYEYDSAEAIYNQYAPYPDFKYDSARISSCGRGYVFRSPNINASSSGGNVEFTSIDYRVGGLIKGKFNFHNIYSYDYSTSQYLEGGHIITEGEFQISIISIDTTNQ